MTTLAIRRSGGANIISIPKAILKVLGLHPGSSLNLSIEGSKIVLTPANNDLTLEELILGSPKEHLNLNTEDKAWLNSKPVGKETEI